MSRERIYNSACAGAHAAADCAASVRIMLGRGVPAGVTDEKAYRDEVRRIGDDLTQAAVDQDLEAKGLRPS